MIDEAPGPETPEPVEPEPVFEEPKPVSMEQGPRLGTTEDANGERPPNELKGTVIEGGE